MKKLKYVYKFLLAIPLVFMVGCVGTDDYEDVLSNQFTQQSTVFIETDDASETIRSVPGGSAIPLEVGVNNAPTSDITVSFKVTKDGASAEAGVDYTVEDAIIYASEVSGSTNIIFLAEGSFVVTVNSASDGSFIAVDNKAFFNVPPPVTVSISWADAFYDYDLYFYKGNQDLDGDLIANTFGTAAFETFDVYPTEGFSSVYIDDFWGDNAGIDVVMFVEIDGETTVYEVVMDMDKFVLVFETSFDADGNPIYDITAL